VETAAALSHLTVNGSITSGTGASSGSILADQSLGTVTVTGDVVGTAASPVVISAAGQAKPTATTDRAIATLLLKGNVTYVNILAGYDATGAGVNADAQIGSVFVGHNWSASNLIAGIGPGSDGQFGTNDDARLSGTGIKDVSTVMSKIGHLTIAGTAQGTDSGTSSTDSFGIEAESIVSASINKVTLPLKPGVQADISVGTTGDFVLRELP
jgi:hypothetical protein